MCARVYVVYVYMYIVLRERTLFLLMEQEIEQCATQSSLLS